MGDLLKKLLYLILGIAAVLAIAAIAISLLIDPNNYRDRIAEQVKAETGRDLVIEGDLDLSIFPWFAFTAGRTTLGNAPGFGDEPFLSFEEARLSFEVMPLIRGEGLKIGEIVLDSFQLNLAVAEDGRNNWQDMAEHTGPRPAEQPDFEIDEEALEQLAEEAAQEAGEEPVDEQDVTLSIAGVEISDAAVRYRDDQAGETYSLTNFNLTTGRISKSDPIDINSSFNFEIQPANLAGDFSIETAIVPDETRGATLGDAEISVVGIEATLALLEGGDGFHLQVDAFSLKSLMTRLGIEPPVTADPDALGKVMVQGDVRFKEGVAVTGLELVVDDTTFTGGLSVADNAAKTISIDLAGDSIDLGRYMAPAEAGTSSGGDAVPVEIPVDLIRALNIRGNMTLDNARLSGMDFENVVLAMNAADGDMRLHPISADLFDGKYEGDVRINAAGDAPALSVNENIRSVNLGSLANAMFDQENITGTINGSFQLRGRGENLAAIQRSLDGSINMELIDGAWEGTDVWYELRRARAVLRQEQPPEPTLPARTQFSNVRVSGPVTDGVFQNEEVFAELPFMRVTGRGTVDLPAAEVDYRLTARILDKPEFASSATPEELEDFTEAEVPLKVTGPLAAPAIAPDLEALLKQEVQKKVEEELKDRLLDKLFGDDD